MFIALNTLIGGALRRSAMWPLCTSYIPLLRSGGKSGYQGYKHVAHPEQEPRFYKNDFSRKLCTGRAGQVLSSLTLAWSAAAC